MPAIFPLTRANIPLRAATSVQPRRRMLSQLIEWGGITLEILLLVRGIWGRLALRYPAFYSYLSFILLQDLVCFAVHRWYHGIYRDVYWTAEFLGLIFGCAVVFEIYRAGLSPFPGTARMARNALAFVFALAVA